MKIVLIRHPPALIESGICYGRLDIAVDPAAATEVGRLAADPTLQGATRVWTSPARRCRDLAEAIARALPAELTIDPRLQELDFGDWEGRSWDSIARAELDRWAASPLTVAPSGGETGLALVTRIRDFYTDLRRERQDCVVVSHGGPLKVLAALLDERPMDLLAAAPPLGSIAIFVCPVDDARARLR